MTHASSMMPEPTPAMLRVPEVARRSNLSTAEVYRRIDTGEIPASRDERGMVVVPVTAVEILRH